MRGFVWLMMLVALISSALLAQSTVAWALDFPEELAPVADSGQADVSVEMKLAADGTMKSVFIVASNRPQSNQAVIDAIRQWHFSPAFEGDEVVEDAVVRRFVFTSRAPPEKAPILLQSPGALSQQRNMPPPKLAYPRQVFFVENDPADTPVSMPNEIWFPFPRESQKAERKFDPGVLLDVVVDASGAVMAARDSGQASPALLKGALYPSFWKHTRFEPARRNGTAVSARARVPVRFYSLPDPTGVSTPEYPYGLRGTGGTVSLTFFVGTDGKVRDLKVQDSPHPQYEAAVIESFVKGPVIPAERLGKPVAMVTALKYTFRPSRNEGKGLPPYSIGNGLAASEKLPETFRYDKPPKITLSIDPVYPFDLAQNGITGSARVAVIINPLGQIHDVLIREATHPAFGASLKASMESWRFEPATREGQPTWAVFNHSMDFSLSAFSAKPLDASARRILAELKKDPRTGIVPPDPPLMPRYQPSPTYPPNVIASDGDSIIVDFFVDRDGSVQLPHATKYRDEALAWAAVTAISRWRFDAPKRDGKPIDVRVNMPVEFARRAAPVEARP